MAEGKEKEKKTTDFSFIQETVKQKKLYQNKLLRRIALPILSGVLFAAAALVVFAAFLPKIMEHAEQEEQEVQPIVIPEDTEEPEPEESTVYITETVSMELEDYKKMYQQLTQIASQTENSMVNISALTVDTDWFDETYTSRRSAAGVLVGDNGVELLILADYNRIEDAQELRIAFCDDTTAQAVMKKYDKNTGLAILSVNLSDVSEETRQVISYADLTGSSRTLQSGEPVIAVGSPVGDYGSVLFGNLTSVSQSAALYDGAYSVLTTDMPKARSGSGVLVNWSGRIVGLIQEQCEVDAQEDTIQAYGISDVKNIIEHLSNNQDIVYMGILGADVTEAVSEAQGIPIGVYVSEVQPGSPAIDAGILPGDIITSISGQEVTCLEDISSVLLKCANGQSVQVLCQRADKNGYQETELSVELKILEE